MMSRLIFTRQIDQNVLLFIYAVRQYIFYYIQRNKYTNQVYSPIVLVDSIRLFCILNRLLCSSSSSYYIDA